MSPASLVYLKKTEYILLSYLYFFFLNTVHVQYVTKKTERLQIICYSYGKRETEFKYENKPRRHSPFPMNNYTIVFLREDIKDYFFFY